MMFIIKHFSCVILNLIKYLYNDFESMQKINEMFVCIIFVKMLLMIAFKSNSCIISYNSIVKILRMIFLYFINDQ